MRTAAGVVATLLHLVAGFFYVASGLVAPLWAVVLLIGWWVVLAVVGTGLLRRRSYLVLLVPVMAFISWLTLLSFGDLFLGWTA